MPVPLWDVAVRRMGPKRRDWERHVTTALELVAGEPEPDEHGRSEDAEEADTERGFEHSPRDQGTDREWHSVTCPCALCVQYTTHEIENNWPAPFLRVVPPQRGDDSA